MLVTRLTDEENKHLENVKELVLQGTASKAIAIAIENYAPMYFEIRELREKVNDLEWQLRTEKRKQDEFKDALKNLID